MFKQALFLSLALCITLCYAASSPVSIFTNGAGGNAKSVGVVNNNCASVTGAIILTDSSTTCITHVTNTGAPNSTFCPTELQGATNLFCEGSSSFCFAANPSTGLIVAFKVAVDGSSVTVVGTYGTSVLVHPTYIAQYNYYQSTSYMVVADYDSTNSLINVYKFQFNITDSSTSSFVSPIVSFAATATAAGLYANPSYFIVAALGQDQYSAYTYTGATAPFVIFGAPHFNNIKSISGDYLFNLYVGATDSSNVNTVSVFDSNTGSVSDTWTLTNAPSSIGHSYDANFVVDSTGASIINKPLTMASYTVTNATCKLGSIQTTITGGAAPYTYILNPSWSTLVSSYSTTNTFTTGLSTVAPANVNATLINNGFFLLHFNLATTGNIENKTSTGAARPGNTYSFSIILVYGGLTYYWCPTCMPATYFYGLEMWINVGLGGQYFAVQAVNSADTRYFKPGDLPVNTWVRLYFDIESYPVISYGYFTVRDMSPSPGPNSNPLYIDGMVLLAYTDMRPRVRVIDSCGVEVSTPPLTVTDDNALRVTTDTPSVTCSPLSYDTDLANDAVITANATGGVPPYTYSWNIGPSTANQVFHQGQQQSRQVVYDNVMADPWGDSLYSKSIIEYDTTYFRSPPYSYSFAPTYYFDGIYFYHPNLNLADYYAFEFWINGGVNGHQYITAVVDATDPYPVNPVETYANVPFIPPNQWVKVTLPIPAGVQSTTFYGIQIVGMRDGNQERVYIDDVYLIASHYVTALDAAGCSYTDHYLDVTAPDVIDVTEIELDYVKCYNTSTGAMYFQATGGTPPYFYNWTISSNTYVPPVPLTSANATNLPEIYASVEVMDSKGCHAPNPYNTVTDGPPILEVLTSTTNAVCHGGLGSLTATSLGGTGPYTYKWGTTSGGVYNTTLQPAPFGIYIDSLAAPFTLFGSDAVFFQCTHRGIVQTLPVHYSHSGHCSMAAIPTDIGDSAPYYNFTVPGDYISLSVGCPGCIDLTIWTGVSLWFALDPAYVVNMSIWIIKNNQSISAPLFFKDVPSLVTTGDAIWQEVYFGFSNSSLKTADTILVMSSSPIPVAIYDDIVLTASKETSRTSVVGIGVNVGYNATVLATAGNYYVNVTDNNGCPKQMLYTVKEPTRINVVPWLFGNGSASLNVSGGTPPYTYNWIGLNATTQSIENIPVGIYTVEVTDSMGCIVDTSFNSPQLITVRAYNKGLSSGLGALVAVGGVVAIFSILMLVKFWAAFSALGSFYCAVLLCGVLISYLAALTLLPRPTDALCTAFPWLLGIAFALVYGCLFIKTWGLYRVWSNAKQYKRTNLTPLYIIKVEAVVVLSEVILMAIWTAIDPPRVRRVKVFSNEVEYQCNTEHPTFWIIFLAIKGAWLIFGAVLSVLTRDVIKKYNESSSISYAIYNITVLLAIGIPLGVLLEQVPGGRLVIEVVITVLAFTFTMVIMFFKSWYNALSDRSGEFNMGNYKTKTQTTQSTHSGSPSNSGSGNGGTNSRDSSKVTSSKASAVSPAMSFSSQDAPATLKNDKNNDKDKIIAI